MAKKAKARDVGPDPVWGVCVGVFGLLNLAVAGALTKHWWFNVGEALMLLGAVVFAVLLAISSVRQQQLVDGTSMAPIVPAQDETGQVPRFTRWLARVIDSFVPNALVSSIYGTAAVMGMGRPAVSATTAISVSILVVVYYGYQAYLIATTGQSLAKRFLKIKIVRDDGSPAGFVHGVLLRDGVLLVATLLAMGALGGSQSAVLVGTIFGLADCLAIFGDDRRCVHDYLAGTKVVPAPAPS